MELLLLERLVLLALLEHVHVGLAQVDLIGVLLKALNEVEIEVLAWVDLLLRVVNVLFLLHWSSLHWSLLSWSLLSWGLAAVAR